jgi:ribonuclease P/MRP protein subunit POP5
MVRIKNRYLLVSILYPDPSGSFPSARVPDLVSFHQPTTDALDAHLLTKAIRGEVSALFGDYGTGAIAESLAGTSKSVFARMVTKHIIPVRYLSTATSTFILRVSRAHYRIAWAALSFMNAVPVKNGRSCVFRVVRVSGTIRKAEEEAIRRAREMVLRARRELGDRGDSILTNILGKEKELEPNNHDVDLMLDDRSDSGEEDYSDGDE